jgi:hypothetical protein
MKRRTFLGAALAAVSMVISSATFGLRAAVSDVCAKVKPRPRGMPLPPVPKWKEATDDIDGADYALRSVEYERSLLSPGLVFPRMGQVWETVRDCELPVLDFIGHPGRPFIVNVRLQKAERVRILELEHPKPLQVRFAVIRQSMQQSIVSRVGDNVLSVRMARTVPILGDQGLYFDELFRLVQDT